MYASVEDSTKTKVIVLDGRKVQLKELGKLPKILREASGLEITGGKNFWSHNDDGIPALYCMDSTGHLIKALQLNHKNRGWEDLTIDDQGNLYVGGFGNNQNDKRDLRIYKLPDPETIKQQPYTCEIIDYTYEDQTGFPPPATKKNFDVDAMTALGSHLYLFTKNRSNPFTGYSKVYQLTQEPGKQVAKVVDSLYLGKGRMLNLWITSADISPDKKTLALLFHDHIWLIRGFTDGHFSGGRIYELPLNNYSHKAGIAFKTNDLLYIVDELEFDMLGGKMYSLDIKPILKDLK
jgi:hypothetical protein